jgi:hypothetical protein
MKTLAISFLLMVFAVGMGYAENDARRSAIQELNRGQANNQALLNPPHWWEFWKDPQPAPEIPVNTAALDEATEEIPQLTTRNN